MTLGELWQVPEVREQINGLAHFMASCEGENPGEGFDFWSVEGQYGNPYARHLTRAKNAYVYFMHHKPLLREAAIFTAPEKPAPKKPAPKRGKRASV